MAVLRMLGRSVITNEKQQALTALIHERFEQITEAKASVEGHTNTNGTSAHLPSSQLTAPSASASPVKHERSTEASELDDDAAKPPAKKKAKKSKPEDLDDDAVYAARLQAEMNNSARPTRGGGAKPKASKPVSKKKTPKKKSANKISAEDDSDIEDASDDNDGQTTERGGAFNVRSLLSAHGPTPLIVSPEAHVPIGASERSAWRGYSTSFHFGDRYCTDSPHIAFQTEDGQGHLGTCQGA